MHERSWFWATVAVAAAALVGWASIPAGGRSATMRSTAGRPTREAPLGGMAEPHVPPGSRRDARGDAEPPVRAPAPTRAGAAGERDAAQRSRALLDSIARLARQHLDAPPAARELDSCSPLTAPRCRASLSAALYEAIEQRIVPAIERGAIDLAQLEPEDSTAVRAAAFERLEHADPLERASALVLLERASQLEPGPLPASAFAALGEKPVIEQQLLLRYSRYAGLRDRDVVSEVAALASADGVDPRAQGAALAALARSETAQDLSDVTRALGGRHAHDWGGWNDRVAPALSLCGAACAEVSAELVAGAADSAALAAQIMRRSPPSDRGELLARLAPALSDSALQQLQRDMDL